MENSDLTQAMQEMMAEMAAMRAELNDLKSRGNGLTPPQIEQPVKPAVSTTRRKALRRLTGGLLAGVGMVGVAAALPEQAEAKLTAKAGRIGAIVTPNGDSTTNDLPSGTSHNYGLMALSGVGNIDLLNDNTLPANNVAVVARSSHTGVFASGSAIGVHCTGNNGVFAYGTGNNNFGVYAIGDNSGVYGSGNTYGVNGVCSGGGLTAGVLGEGNNIGVWGVGKNSGVGIYGDRGPNGTIAAIFNGNVQVNGTITKSGVGFKIDHPLDPANKYLYHTSIESPDMMNIYNGIVTLNEQGEATITMPDWFEALNSDFRYQLTALYMPSPNLHISQRLIDKKFKIAGGKPGQEVSWMVTGIRQDAYAKAHRMPVEKDKTSEEKGKYIHPELFGQPEEMSVHPRPKTAK